MKTQTKPTHTQGEWKVYKQLPDIEIESGQRLLKLYGTTATAQANANFICKAVNNHDKLTTTLEKIKTECMNALNTHYMEESFSKDGKPNPFAQLTGAIVETIEKTLNDGKAS